MTKPQLPRPLITPEHRLYPAYQAYLRRCGIAAGVVIVIIAFAVSVYLISTQSLNPLLVFLVGGVLVFVAQIVVMAVCVMVWFYLHRHQIDEY